MSGTRRTPGTSRVLEDQARAIVEGLDGRWCVDRGLCCCPAHDDRTPSLSVRIGTTSLLLKCFAGCDTRDVIRAIRRVGVLDGDRIVALHDNQPDSRGDDDRHRQAAIRLWGAARPVEGTVGERYLATRGLSPPYRQVRFHARTPLGRGADRVHLPALVAAVRDDSGIIAVQRTFLHESGTKRGMVQPRRTLGRLGSGAVRLTPAGERLGLAEGYETACAAMQILRLPVWASLGSTRMAHVAIPPAVRTVVLLPDHGHAGILAEAAARAAFLAQGFRVETVWPPTWASDWADVLMRQEERGRGSRGIMNG